MSRWRWAWVALLLAAFGLRLPGLWANHFHADEALFASWARLIAVWRDPLLATQAVDKPPLLFYLQALAYPLMGPVEWAARLPSLIASLLLIPLSAEIANALYPSSRKSAIFTAALVAFAPLTIQFSATAFLDPLLTTLLAASWLALVRRRAGWAGIWFGLALLTKYQALLFLPLLVGQSWLTGDLGRDARRFFLAVMPFAAGLLAWEWARTGELALWQTQIGNFGGVRLSWSWELWPRLRAWMTLSQMALGGWLLLVVLGVAALALAVGGWRKADRDSAEDLLLIAFALGYALFHWLAAIPVWDRYWLPLLPVLALILARGLTLLWDWRREAGWISAVGLSAVLLMSALAARQAAWPLGGRPDADRGAHEVAAALADAPYGTVLYDHWYSWHWGYHFFDKGVYVSWFPHGAALAEDLTAFGDSGGERLIVLPDGPAALPIQRAVASAEYRLIPVLRTASDGGMILWRIEPQPEGEGD